MVLFNYYSYRSNYLFEKRLPIFQIKNNPDPQWPYLNDCIYNDCIKIVVTHTFACLSATLISLRIVHISKQNLKKYFRYSHSILNKNRIVLIHIISTLIVLKFVHSNFSNFKQHHYFQEVESNCVMQGKP